MCATVRECSGTCQPDIHIARPSCHGKHICKKPAVPTRMSTPDPLYKWLGHVLIKACTSWRPSEHLPRQLQAWHAHFPGSLAQPAVAQPCAVGQSANRGSLLPEGCLLYERCHGIHRAGSEDGEFLSCLDSMNLRSPQPVLELGPVLQRCPAVVRLVRRMVALENVCSEQ